MASYGIPEKSELKHSQSNETSQENLHFEYRPVVNIRPERVNKEIQVGKSNEDEEQQTDEVEVHESPIETEIQKREREIENIKQALQKITEKSQTEMYTRIDKNLWDRQLEIEKRRIESSGLENQILQKQKLKSIEEVEKEKERGDRLEMINQLRKAEVLERIDAISKAQKYREELNMQAYLQKQIHDIEEHQYRAQIPRPKENPPPSHILETSPFPPGHSKNLQYSPEKYRSPNIFYFTKKSPKTLIFNPITGELKDTAISEQRSFSHLKGFRHSPDPRKTDEERNRSYIKDAGNYIVKGRQSPNN